jgi:hypothetical protein
MLEQYTEQVAGSLVYGRGVELAWHGGSYYG